MNKIIKEEKFQIKPFRKIIIGDPMYLDSIENGTDSGCEKNLVAIYDKIPFSNRDAYVTIREIEDCYEFNGEKHQFYTIEVIIGSFKKGLEKIYDTHLNHKYYPNKVKKHNDLGCDTAHFIIETDTNYDEISTGADGYYGDFYHYKNNDAYIISLSIDEDMMSFDEAVSLFKLLFQVKEAKSYK